MRPLPQTRETKRMTQKDFIARHGFALAVLLAMRASILGCGGGGAGSGTQSSPPPSIMVSATPSAATVLVGETLSFSASVSNSSDTAKVTITSDISVSVSPNPASVELGAAQTFQASIASQGRPDTSIRWSLSGASRPGACGTIDSSGRYTAPQILPGSTAVSAVATSVADPTKQTSANLLITSQLL